MFSSIYHDLYLYRDSYLTSNGLFWYSPFPPNAWSQRLTFFRIVTSFCFFLFPSSHVTIIDDGFCISQSRHANHTRWDDFHLHTSQNNKRQRIQCNDTDSSLATVLPAGWTMHKSVFFLSKNGHEWSTHHGKHIFANRVVYPNFVISTAGDIFDNGEDIWVLRAVEKGNELGFRRIDISCGESIPTK